MNKKIFFITGTDTDVGKTYITVGLLQKCKELKLRALGIKPIATGCSYKNNKLFNYDALLLQENSNIMCSYEQTNPVALKIASSPNIAAALENTKLDPLCIIDSILKLKQLSFECLFIEGVGGWQVPISSSTTTANLVKAINCPVILVVGLKLGCINHAILTYQNIIACGMQCVAWVGNCISPNFDHLTENITTIQQFINAPYLGTIWYQTKAKDNLKIELLF